MTHNLLFRGTEIIRPLFWIVALIAAFSAQNTHAETPVEFARRFATFEFVYHESVQTPEVFLKTKSGDCDDFATLAADVLRKNGYTPRLFAIRMKGETHVVCYVPETGSYLDYNNRAAANPLVPCDGNMQDIASKVAQSFGREWLSAYEFSYRERVKWLVNTILHNTPGGKTLMASN